MGVMVGVPFMAVDLRVRAGIFAVGGATGTGATDPATYAPLIRERPVLLASADRDEFFNRASVTALYEAFGGYQELLQFPERTAIGSIRDAVIGRCTNSSSPICKRLV